MQTPEQARRRELKDRLIDEHRQANAEALQKLKEEIPVTANQYLATMGKAMAIMRGVE